jgi:hypothetical protein
MENNQIMLIAFMITEKEIFAMRGIDHFPHRKRIIDGWNRVMIKLLKSYSEEL